MRALFVLSATVLWLLAMGTASGAVVKVAAPGSTYAGQTFSAQINVEAVSDLYAAQFSLSFNPAVLQVISVSEGPFLKQGGASTFFQSGTIDNIAGTITAAFVTRMGLVPGVTGSGTVATITFYAKNTGSSALTLSGVLLSDSSANPIPYSTQNGAVNIVPPPSPPDTWITAGPSGTITTTNATFAWSGSDSDGYVAHYRYRMDSQGWTTTGDTSHTFTGLSKGSHTFQVAAVDNNGLSDPSPAQRSFTVYFTANPETQIVSGPNGTVEGDTATFTWTGTDPDGQVAHYLYRLDDQAWAQTTNTSITYTDLAYTNHTFQVKAVDDEALEDPTPAERVFTLTPYWWEEEIARLNQTVNDLEEQLQAAQEELEETEEEVDRLEDEVESLEGQVETLQDEKLDLQEEIQDLESEKSELAANLSELEDRNDELKANVTDLSGKLSAAEQTCRTLSEQVDGLTSQLADKDAELQETKADLAEALGEVESLGNQMAALQQEVQDLKDDVDELEADKESLEADKESLEADKSSLQDEVDRLQAELSTANQEKADAMTEIAEKQAEIDALEDEKEALDQDLDEMEEENESLARTKQILMIALVCVAVLAVVFLGLAVRYRGRAGGA